MTFLHEAGWAVWLVLAAGLASIAWAAQYARGRQREQLVMLTALAALTLVFGALGTATGLQASVRYLDHVPEKWIFLIGLREALNNLVLSLGFVAVDLLLVVALPRKPGAAQPLPAPATT